VAGRRASVENEQRIARLPRRRRLAGFPLLHVDFYREDRATQRWPEWVRAHRLSRTAPERRIRFQRIAPALDAVLAHAGLAHCGIALLREPLASGRLSLPSGIEAGSWTWHAFQARYRPDSAMRPQLRRFRQWLFDEVAATRAWLGGLVPRRDAGGVAFRAAHATMLSRVRVKRTGTIR
jgi:LysR family glycine cleavage system transcriptional activator